MLKDMPLRTAAITTHHNLAAKFFGAALYSAFLLVGKQIALSDSIHSIYLAQASGQIAI